MAKSPPLKSILKTADTHNADPLLLKNNESSSKAQHVTIQESKDSPSESKKKGPTPPIKSDDPITDGLCLLSDNDKGKKESSIDPTALEIHKMLSVKPLSDAEKAARVKSNSNLSGGSLPEYYDANFCEIDMSSRDFTPMICNAEVECHNNIEVEIGMAEQYVPDDQDDFLASLRIDNLDQLIIPAPPGTISRTDGGQGLALPRVVRPPSSRDLDLQDKVRTTWIVDLSAGGVC